MSTMMIEVARTRVISLRPFDEVVARVTSTIGRPNMAEFHAAIARAMSIAEIEDIVRTSVGPSELMEFARYDAGSILRKENGTQRPRILRLLVGNPLIMKEMARTVPDAASYAPVTILVDERAEEVRLSYDSMASLIAPYGSQSALAVARDLDAKVGKLLETAARRGLSR